MEPVYYGIAVEPEEAARLAMVMTRQTGCWFVSSLTETDRDRGSALVKAEGVLAALDSAKELCEPLVRSVVPMWPTEPAGYVVLARAQMEDGVVERDTFPVDESRARKILEMIDVCYSEGLGPDTDEFLIVISGWFPDLAKAEEFSHLPWEEVMAEARAKVKEDTQGERNEDTQV